MKCVSKVPGVCHVQRGISRKLRYVEEGRRIAQLEYCLSDITLVLLLLICPLTQDAILGGRKKPSYS